MSTTTKAPLVSDERIDSFVSDGEPREYVFGALTVGKKVRDLYEAELSRLRSDLDQVLGVLQTLVDNPPRVRGEVQSHIPTVQAKALLSKHKAEERPNT